MTCAKCMQDDIATAFPFGVIAFSDDGRYEIACPKGHSSITLLQQQKFEILFDIGAYAIVDGYYREAVTSFASSLERFYEFFIKVMCAYKKIDFAVTSAAWKHVSIQSERQVGAFVFLYLLEFGESPKLLGSKKASFRNDVVHKGKIPSKSEAVEYGQDVLNFARPIIKLINERCKDAVNDVVFNYISEIMRPSDAGVATSTMCHSTILSISNGDPAHNENDLVQALEEIALQKSIWEVLSSNLKG